MTTTKIPQFGDKEILPKGRVVRPSVERMPFDSRGRLKPEGPGPLKEVRFYEAADIDDLPWTRKRGDEWTTADFRRIVFAWIVQFFDNRKDWAGKWDVREVAAAQRSGRLPEKSLHLVIGITARGEDPVRIETAAMFPPDSREENPDRANIILKQAEQVLDALHDAQG